jgi:haloalkane dehalogenase
MFFFILRQQNPKNMKKNMIRTPEERFEKIVDFPYKPNYMEVNGGRIHYIDEGSGEPILALHGEPTWSYLYRKMVPILSGDYRFISMDFFGFGRSDKFRKVKDYTFGMHFDTLSAFVDQLDLKGIHLVVQDWGGLLGLSLLGAQPERFKSVVIMNTFLPIGDRPMNKAFKIWKRYARFHPNLPVGGVVKWGSYRKDQFTEQTKYGYDAPFPGRKYKAGPRSFPMLVPQKPDDPGVEEMKQARTVLSQWNKPCLVLFSDKDPIMSPARKFFRQLVPTAEQQEDIWIKQASHFLQEDAGEEIADQILNFLRQQKISAQ